ncbi:MAG: hypothetical protein JSS82_00025 [Bacteroidetes bacterium]|nr:hypothetical protein [Bacteroidota bacterium]
MRRYEGNPYSKEYYDQFCVITKDAPSDPYCTTPHVSVILRKWSAAVEQIIETQTINVSSAPANVNTPFAPVSLPEGYGKHIVTGVSSDSWPSEYEGQSAVQTGDTSMQL